MNIYWNYSVVCDMNKHLYLFGCACSCVFTMLSSRTYIICMDACTRCCENDQNAGQVRPCTPNTLNPGQVRPCTPNTLNPGQVRPCTPNTLNPGQVRPCTPNTVDGPWHPCAAVAQSQPMTMLCLWRHTYAGVGVRVYTYRYAGICAGLGWRCTVTHSGLQ
jgi:hypothetical protein